MAMFSGLLIKHYRTQKYNKQTNQQRKTNRKITRKKVAKMASNNNNNGEERRRRLAERGSDRMALITGRINALPPTPPSITSSPSYRHGQSMSVSAFDSHFDNVSSPLPRHARPHSLASSAFASDFNQDNAGLNLFFFYIYIRIKIFNNGHVRIKLFAIFDWYKCCNIDCICRAVN